MSTADAAAVRELPIVFYDGNCGLCHRTIRFVIDEDPVTGEDRVLSGRKGFSGFSRTTNNAFRDDNQYALIFDFRQEFVSIKFIVQES